MDTEKLNYSVKATMVDGATVRVDTAVVDPLTEIRTVLLSRIVSAEEEVIRNSLIALGWSPPGTACPHCGKGR